MTKEKNDVSSLRRAATASYMMGIWEFLSVFVFLAVVFQAISPFLSVFGMGTPPTYAEIYAILDGIFLGTAVVALISIPITLFYAYYLLKVGGIYSTGSLKFTGACGIIMAIGYPALIYGLYIFKNMVYAAIFSPPPDFTTFILESVGTLLTGAVIVGLFGFLFFIGIIISSSAMKTRTGIGDFNTAMWLAIVGIFVQITFPIAMIIMGSGFSKLAKQQTGAAAVMPAAMVAPTKAVAKGEIMYCPYCGARVESDALFCPTCGSSLKRD